ncbi:DoxX family membrane protein [Streptomyces hainanensis]|uniref:DoxX family membrane protein n=1 Tax=Streptomyces hainanensis TaxID=402648 RepID=A0A4R4T6L5_9ACTN|nr:DoxX family membrane protein [Streptomyces hainanensis]TDC72557.1 DoxX family membrane protein [Streptomyces hainanensis]
MSVDTRTPHGLSMDEPVLSMVKVPCDPAQVIVNHASFRVKLATPPPISITIDDTAPLARVPAAAGGRRRPLVWTGRSAPGDPGASGLLQAVREAGRGVDVATQVLPRITPVVAQRGPRPPERPGLVAPPPPTEVLPVVADLPPQDRGRPADRRPGDGRQAYQPGHRAGRMNLGVVLLPLRVLLGFVAIYAGMGKLTDPVYFDGGLRGSLYAWLDSLEPWTVAAPLHSWALAHPVGAGLTVAFIQIIVGVLTVFGLWQRFAAGLGASLSLALLLTVSWQNGPAYDTPDAILFAAWTPLVIAGAPVYSLDFRLATEAWRTLGPRAPLAELRRRVLRRGAMLATLLVGLALLIGSMLGSAVRSAQFATVPEPGEPPRNHLPGERLPDDEDEAGEEAESSAGPTEGSGAAGDEESAEGEPGDEDANDPTDEASAGAESTGPGAEQQAPPSEQTVPAPQQSAPPSEQQYYPPEDTAPAAPEPDTGTSGGGGEPAPQDPSAESGGERSSLGPIGGLLG